MNQYLTSLSDYILSNELSRNNSGFLHGDAGILLFLYLLSRNTTNPKIEAIADSYLEKVFKNLEASSIVDFENGLTGIGWVVEYLVQNGFAEGNTDEILEEIDTKVYSTLISNSLNSYELTNGLSGYLLYLNSRLKNGKNGSMAYRINKELLILTINKIDEIAPKLFPDLVKELHFDLFWRFPVIIFALIEASKLNIYNRKIELIFKQWIVYFETYIPSLHINRLYLALAYNRINAHFPHKILEKQTQVLLFASNFDELETEYDSNHHGIRYGWPGALWVLYRLSEVIPEDYPNYELIKLNINNLRKNIKIVNKHYSKEQSIKTSLHNWGISGGIAGLGLLELKCPGLFRIN